MPVKLKPLFLLLAIIVSIAGKAQNASPIKGNLSPAFDLSPDTKNVVLSITNGPVANLYLFSLADTKLTQLTNGEGYYSRPVFSPLGDKIIFLSKSVEAETSQLCSFAINNKKIKKLTDDKVYVTEATYLPGGKEIMYGVAGAVTSPSPLIKKTPRNIDLYIMKADGGGKPRKITNFNAQEFSEITPNQKGDTILCRLVCDGADGIYLISLADGVKTKVQVVNNPRPELGPSFYGAPAFSKSNQVVSFVAPYQLYLMNIADRKWEEVWSTLGKAEQAMPIISKFSATDGQLFFSVLPLVNKQYSNSAKLFAYDVATKKVAPVL